MKKHHIKKLALVRETVLHHVFGRECDYYTRDDTFMGCAGCSGSCEPPDVQTPTLDGGCHDFTGGAC